MSRQNLYALAVCFCFFYAASYFLTELIQAPLLWYYSLDRIWVYGSSPPPGLKMGWYGKVLLSLLIAAVGTGSLAAGLRLSRREVGPQLQGLLDLAAMSTIVFVMYYIARSLAYKGL